VLYCLTILGEDPLEKLKTSTRQVEGVTIVDLSGRITLGEASVVVRDVINDLMGKGNKKILLNLGKVDYIDSSGIGVLVSGFSTVRGQGGELKLVNLSQEDPRPAPYHQAVQPLRRQGRRGRSRCVLPPGCSSVSHTRAL
jgi:anti-sigma B factor antagonist